jgi:flagellar hook assembly protein FlgD
LQGKSDAPIQASIYNIKGQLVKTLLIDKNMIIWDGTDENKSVVSKGIYLIKLKQNNKTIVSKILKLK